MNTQEQHNSFYFNPNDLVLIVGESVGQNCNSSIRFAQSLGRDGRFGKVLHINTLQRRKKYRKTIYETLGAGYDIDHAPDGAIFHSCEKGKLVADAGFIDTMYKQADVRTIVVNSWELASLDHRTREKLLYQILTWNDDYDLTIIVYAQQSSAMPRPGYMMRGGFGKLCGIADVVIEDLNSRADSQEHAAMLAPEAVALTQERPATVEESATITERTDFGERLITPFGTEVVYTEDVYPFEASDDDVQLWDSLGIPRSARRVYFNRNPREANRRIIVFEERIVDHKHIERSIEAWLSEYSFPEVVPLVDSPLVGVKLEDYLDRYRKPIPVHVQNDVVEMEELAEAI